MIEYYGTQFFFFNDTATTEIYTLSLHDALPISIVAFFVSVQLIGPLAMSAPFALDRRDGVDEFLEDVESCALAAVSITANGTPFASVTCRLEPGLPRSSGLTPVFSSSFSRGCWPNRGWPWRSLSDRPYPVDRALRVRLEPPFKESGKHWGRVG